MKRKQLTAALICAAILTAAGCQSGSSQPAAADTSAAETTTTSAQTETAETTTTTAEETEKTTEAAEETESGSDDTDGSGASSSDSYKSRIETVHNNITDNYKGVGDKISAQDFSGAMNQIDVLTALLDSYGSDFSAGDIPDGLADLHKALADAASDLKAPMEVTRTMCEKMIDISERYQNLSGDDSPMMSIIAEMTEIFTASEGDDQMLEYMTALSEKMDEFGQIQFGSPDSSESMDSAVEAYNKVAEEIRAIVPPESVRELHDSFCQNIEAFAAMSADMRDAYRPFYDEVYVTNALNDLSVKYAEAYSAVIEKIDG